MKGAIKTYFNSKYFFEIIYKVFKTFGHRPNSFTEKNGNIFLIYVLLYTIVFHMMQPKKWRNRCASALIWFKNRIRFSKSHGKMSAKVYLLFFPSSKTSIKEKYGTLIFLLCQNVSVKKTSFWNEFLKSHLQISNAVSTKLLSQPASNHPTAGYII